MPKLPRHLFVAASFLALAACGSGERDDSATTPQQAQTGQVARDYGYDTYANDNLADTMASNDGAGSDTAAKAGDIADPEDRPVMQAQVVLDRQGFGPGVIDGKIGLSTENALRGFQEANDLEPTAKLDEATKTALMEWSRIPATRVVTIPASWGEQEFFATPDDPADQAKMERLGYTSLDEKLAERFHTTVDVLKSLNPGGIPAGLERTPSSSAKPSTAAGEKSAKAAPKPSPTASANRAGKGDESFAPEPGPAAFFTAGQQIRVPNVGADRIAPGAIGDVDWQRTLSSLGVGSEQPDVDRIVVSKSEGTLRAFTGDKLVALFTVTSGSSHDPLPLGEWKILGVAHNPPFAYNPELFWDVSDTEEKQQLPPGPNGPVGVVWIDLSKEHYGIHGTPEPQTIGRTQSHGCVRLTNWDAARLSEMVSQSTQVVFES